MNICVSVVVDITGFDLGLFLKGVRRSGFGWTGESRIISFLASYDEESEVPNRLDLYFIAKKDFLLLKIEYLFECAFKNGGDSPVPPIVGLEITTGKKSLFIRESIPLPKIKEYIEYIEMLAN